MSNPKFVNLQFHPSYCVQFSDKDILHEASMFAIDEFGCVWATTLNEREGWHPWTRINDFDT